jgi:hypothetical protein
MPRTGLRSTMMRTLLAKNAMPVAPRSRPVTANRHSMRRRVFNQQPISRLAIWARRIALFSLVATLIAIIIVRSGALDLLPALSTLAGALVLACVAILLACGAGIVIWREGVGGGRYAVTAFFVGLVLIAYPLYLGARAYRLPAIYDITTDPIDPPRFDAIARLRPRDANPITYAGLYTAEQQHNAYADIEPDDTTVSPQEAYDAAMKVVTKRRWRVVDARPPQAGVPALPPPGAKPRQVDTRSSPNVGARDGIIEAVARTPILGFRDDVVVRVRATSDGARIDVRSASRYGRNDLGTNASRVRNLIDDIDDVLAAPQKKAPAPVQPPAKGASSAKR